MLAAFAWGLAACIALLPVAAKAESMADALASAYVANSVLNAARAQLRSTDEEVPLARSGHRPTVTLGADVGRDWSRGSLQNQISPTPGQSSSTWEGQWSSGVNLNIEQPIFLGFQTKNSVKAAQTSVLAGRQQLKNVQQDVLLQTVQAFMGVVQAQVILNLRAQNVEFLRAQVRAANDRLNVGEGTRTDVAQTNSRLSRGMSGYAGAVADVNRALAVYEQVVGHRPQSVGAVYNIDHLLPKTLEAGLAISLAHHPRILSATYNIDVASYNVAIQEGALLPSITLQGSASHRNQDGDRPGSGAWSQSASIVGVLNVPIYQRGQIAASVRQSKEILGQRRIELDQERSDIRQIFISAWGELDAARAQVTAAEAEVSAQQLVLSGVIEEQRVGQRTTLDVLDAQQDLLDAQETLVVAQSNRIIAAYQLLSAQGKLDAETLDLNVTLYDPTEHYEDVKDKWFGLRTPDGR